MGKVNYTPSQAQAINHNLGNAIVSAAAGSGKTFVVIERIIRLITKENVSVDNILAVTFTRLAAEEMKDKLKNAVIKRYNETGDTRLKEEYDKIPSSSISTIHSFCIDLLRRYFYAVNLDANFQVLETVKVEQLKNDAISEVFDELYSKKDGEFYELLKLFVFKRKDKRLREIVLKMQKFIESEQSFEGFLKNSENLHNNPLEIINGYVLNSIKKRFNLLLKDLNLLSNLVNGDTKYQKRFSSLQTGLLEIINASNVYEVIQILKLPNNDNKDDSEISLKLNEIKDGIKKLIDELKEYSITEQEIVEIQTVGLKTVRLLFNLTKAVIDKFTSLKREENGVDFSDLERLTAQLLKNPEIKSECLNRYKYIFIDEYQDVNGVQEDLINSLQNGNEFMVGDSKQSIYAFRGSALDIFTAKDKAYAKGEGASISLDNNFRSAENIVNFVNNVFSRIMTEEFGGYEYKNHPMIYGGGYNGNLGIAEINPFKKPEEEVLEEKELGIYSVVNEDKKVVKNQITPTARAVLQLTKNALNTKYYDIKDNTFKQIDYGDIAILLRSTKGEGESIVTALVNSGIPVSFEGKEDILEYPETQALIDLIKFLYSFRQDIPLASVLLNFGGFNESELLEIRKTYASKITFYECVENYAKENKKYSKRLSDFIKYFNKMRVLSEFTGAGEILNRIILDAKWDVKLLSLFGGEQRVKRVQTVISATVIEGKNLSVYEVYNQLDAILSGVTSSNISGENTVKVMTIHASKGLEYPCVILAGLDKKFNKQDQRETVLMDRVFGLAPKIIYPNLMQTKKSKAMEAVKFKMNEQQIFEEIRVFYVALTRAKYRLHVVVEDKNLKQENSLINVLNAQTQATFITGKDAPVNPIILDAIIKEVKGEVTAGNISNVQLENQIKESLNFVYPNALDTLLPVKTSVSSVNHSDEEYFERTYMFGESSAEIGTSYHRFLELCDFYNCNVEEDLKVYEQSKLISKKQVEMLDVNKLKAILKMPIFNEIKDYSLYKEQKFCHFVSGKEIGLESNSNVLIQGVIDLLAVKDGEGILIDYKFSTVKNDQDLIKSYLKQLSLYKKAIETSLKIKVEKAYLVNILQEKLIEISI